MILYDLKQAYTQFFDSLLGNLQFCETGHVYFYYLKYQPQASNPL